MRVSVQGFPVPHHRLQDLPLVTKFLYIALVLSVSKSSIDMASVLNVIEHSIPGQHIREYPKGTKHCQEDTLQLCVKQYVPTSTPEVEFGTGLTIIAVPGNGFPKVSANSNCLLECQHQRQHL